MDIKRMAQADPATIVRCGRSPSQQALQSFNTVTEASGLPEKLALHVGRLGGHEWMSTLTNYWCAFTREGTNTLKTSQSVVVVGQGRDRCVW